MSPRDLIATDFYMGENTMQKGTYHLACVSFLLIPLNPVYTDFHCSDFPVLPCKGTKLIVICRG